MGKISGVIVVLMIAVVSWSAVAAEAEAAFVDVAEDYWAAEEIEYLSGQGIINGYPDGTFAPNQDVTRHQAASMIAEALDLELDGRPDPGFIDVDENTPHFREIAATAEEGVFQGSQDAFRPGETMSRAQMAAVLARVFPQEDVKRVFYSDVSSTHWAFEYISEITDAGIAKGKDGGSSFAPAQGVTRAELSVFLTRAIVPDERIDPS
ncbi:S-layer homology domain-containing protein [Salibacterium aidingense]|uniref:S-layer homology domain-containing protein n=1 Tax=Salibacterium aidingense TaxID=384933 RepID=UPI00041314E8|nr:S-layer homology domain-containing protein [Salibacterium aidingense]